jgi:hypothetical protein
MRNRVILLLATALVAPRATVAQVPLTSNALGLDSPTFTDLQTRLASRDIVRVRGTFGQVIVRRPALTTDSLLAPTDISGMPGPRLGLRDVTSIQVRGGASGTGAIVGAGVGFAGGLAFSVALIAGLCYEDEGGACNNDTALVITLGSTAAGALLGALIGAPLKKWHTVYRAR